MLLIHAKLDTYQPSCICFLLRGGKEEEKGRESEREREREREREEGTGIDKEERERERERKGQGLTKKRERGVHLVDPARKICKRVTKHGRDERSLNKIKLNIGGLQLLSPQHPTVR